VRKNDDMKPITKVQKNRCASMQPNARWMRSDFRNIFIVACLVFSSLVFGIQALYYCGILLACTLFLRTRAERLLPILIFMMPLENMFRGTINLQLVTLGLCVLLLKLLLNKGYRVGLTVIAIVFMVIISMLMTILLSDGSLVLNIMRLVVNFMIISGFHFISPGYFHSNRKVLIGSLIFGCFTLGIFSVMEVVFTDGATALLATRMYGIMEDPNYISSYFAIAIAILVYDLYTEKTGSFRKLMLVLSFVSFGMLTQSRGFLFAVLPSFMVLTLMIFRVNQSVKQKTGLVIGALVATLGMIYNYDFVMEMMDNIFFRIGALSDDGGSGRLWIWRSIIAISTESPKNFFFGAPNAIAVAAHNLFLDILINYGAIMLILVISLYTATFKLIIGETNTRAKLVGLLPLFTMGIAYLFLNALLINVFFYSFVMICVMFSYEVSYKEM
jgi:hypothetical protein